ncbi:hypothetical protein SPRG_03439 [Saprolegnia parasitica CBS 223.65]|uniref:Uncharacterized protein n=1 Tax=Saprolegnia parasitica (strain CBS 223.65) TaxID=695850 RepID=A0A067CLV8_SAPPC|nr:hypothetical protein SPRG_03439 [Saprolegnia parasitica CBS 223.65]KDO31513.1 hypothetical protein SPRG_03439 [Saprolegnia parasitica CBS 223.65]|eukprot:XP_012197423.1 hypothetical protein SPRG_03439 [Saprolegnia parasitica CBS 223.65]
MQSTLVAQSRIRRTTTWIVSLLISSVAVAYVAKPSYNGLTLTFSGSQISQLHPFTVIDSSNLRFYNLLLAPNAPALLQSLENLTQTTQFAEPLVFAQLVTNASEYLSSMDATTTARHLADLDVVIGTHHANTSRPVRCIGTAGSPLDWVNGFCVSYTERKVYHAWTSRYFYDGEEARGGAIANAFMLFTYDGDFLSRRRAETLLPDAVAVAGLGYFRVNHAWVRTIEDPFSFQGVRDDGAAIVVVSFLSVLNFNGAKIFLGLQAPNLCYDVLERIDYGYTNLVTAEYIWLGPQLATYIAQFVVVLAALGSVEHDVSVSILVDLISATFYSSVLLFVSLLGKYYLVFNLSSMLRSDSILSIYLISVISLYHNLIVSHCWPSKLFVALNYTSISIGIFHRVFLTLLALAVTGAETFLGCSFNTKLQVGTNPTPCILGTGNCFNEINSRVLAVMAMHLAVLSLYVLAITLHFRRHPRQLVKVHGLLGYAKDPIGSLAKVSATTFETHCYGQLLDRFLASRYLCVDARRENIGTSTAAVMTLGFVPMRCGLLIRFKDYATFVVARLLPMSCKKTLRISIPVATLANNSVDGPLTYVYIHALPAHDLRIGHPACFL